LIEWRRCWVGSLSLKTLSEPLPSERTRSPTLQGIEYCTAVSYGLRADYHRGRPVLTLPHILGVDSVQTVRYHLKSNRPID
jgi:hypothetical protein